MYNTDLPRRADLPTSAQLKRSSLIAAVSACAILVTIVLPSEYAIDPLGIGGVLGLTKMGEIKTQLAAEAARGAATVSAPVQQAGTMDRATGDALSRRLDAIEAFLATQPAKKSNDEAELTGTLGAMAAAEPTSEAVQSMPISLPNMEPVREVVQDTSAPLPVGRSDEVTFTLAPSQGAEIKLVMQEGARASFAWASTGGVVNVDTHGDAPGQSASYEKGRGIASNEGTIEAAFDGNHGWFWRNRGSADVTIILRTNGDYAELKRIS